MSDQVALSQLIGQTGNIAAFVASLYTSDLELMKSSLQDHVIEPQRAKLIPHFYDLQDIALKHGAMNYTISGAGPSMFGFAQNTLIAENAVKEITEFLHKKSIRSQAYISPINNQGAYKM